MPDRDRVCRPERLGRRGAGRPPGVRLGGSPQDVGVEEGCRSRRERRTQRVPCAGIVRRLPLAPAPPHRVRHPPAELVCRECIGLGQPGDGGAVALEQIACGDDRRLGAGRSLPARARTARSAPPAWPGSRAGRG